MSKRPSSRSTAIRLIVFATVLCFSAVAVACQQRNEPADAPAATVDRFFHRFESFDTRGMSELMCPEKRSDFESAIFLLKAFMGFGNLNGIEVSEISWEDPAVSTISSDGTQATVQVGGRLNFGMPIGSMALDEVVSLRKDGAGWCIADDPTAHLS